MFNYWLIKNYFKYKLFSRHRRGHGIHSPFVFDFIVNVLNKKIPDNIFHEIENLRKQYKKNNNTIDINDLGAGSHTNKSNKRKISEIAKNSVEDKKVAKLLYKICKYYNISNVLELGTSLGITSSYITLSSPNVNLTTIEGCNKIAGIAKATFEDLKLSNIKLIINNFDDELPKQLEKNNFDLIFFDGNHKYSATIKYFNLALKHISNDSIFIFDDIYWSQEMTKAWNEIKSNDKVKLTLDLFDVGIVFFRKELSKQNFIIRY